MITNATNEQVEFDALWPIASVCRLGVGVSLISKAQECPGTTHTAQVDLKSINIENCIFYMLSVCPVAGVDALVDHFQPPGRNFETLGVCFQALL